MPRLPINYANTVIYKIVCNDLSITECYVGHTTDFTVRKMSHKNCCRNESTAKNHLRVYQIIRDTGGWENYSMVEVEKYPCKDSKEACAKEREWYEKLNARLNTHSPQRIQDTISEYKKQHWKDNREKYMELKRQHYNDNKEKISLLQSQYRELHKEEIRDRKKKTFICECGKETTIDNKGQHLRTKFHQQFVRTTETPTP